jgi:hypothetical protein
MPLRAKVLSNRSNLSLALRGSPLGKLCHSQLRTFSAASLGPAVRRAMMVRGGGSCRIAIIGAVFNNLRARSGEGAFEAFCEGVAVVNVGSRRQLRPSNWSGNTAACILVDVG